ncbi:lasso peptide biosynthesis B2 protein [Streptomyces netropsis]|uniref:lasso peptide biosynthesis B2 protein n=1 Tax=Streptomyces netropsis TaxID=55404 RepID=UPI00379CAEF0
MPSSVAVVFPAVAVVVNYATGRAHLRPVLAGKTDFPGDTLVIHHSHEAPSWGTVEVGATLAPPPYAPLAWRLVALPALLATAAVGAAGPHGRKFHRLVRLASIGRSLPQAPETQVRDAVRAVRWAARLMPARWACLEQSTAGALLLAASGRRAEWRHGIATDPVRLHAWIEDAAGQPVEEPADTSLYVVTYTPDGPGPKPKVRRGVPRERSADPAAW